MGVAVFQGCRDGPDVVRAMLAGISSMLARPNPAATKGADAPLVPPKR